MTRGLSSIHFLFPCLYESRSLYNWDTLSRSKLSNVLSLCGVQWGVRAAQQILTLSFRRSFCSSEIFQGNSSEVSPLSSSNIQLSINFSKFFMLPIWIEIPSIIHGAKKLLHIFFTVGDKNSNKLIFEYYHHYFQVLRLWTFLSRSLIYCIKFSFCCTFMLKELSDCKSVIYKLFINSVMVKTEHSLKL